MVTEIINKKQLSSNDINRSGKWGITDDALRVCRYRWEIINNNLAIWYTTINRTNKGYPIYPANKW